MKYFKVSIIAVLLIIMALPALAQRRHRIVDAKALLTSAKIAINANPPRYDEAMELLDQVLTDNGPVAEAYFRRGNIKGEFATKENSDLQKKLDYIKAMALDFDSLEYTCGNKDVEKKYRKDCKKFMELADSVRVYFWRNDYQEGINIINNIENVHSPNYKNATDSASEAQAFETLKAAADSSRLYFEMAYVVDPSEYKPLEGIGVIYDRLKDYEKSAEYFAKAYDVAPDSNRAEISQNIAYAYLQGRDWEKSITWLKKFSEFMPDDIPTLSNIAIVYNNLQMRDSALAYNKKVLAISPNDAGANYDIGTYYLLESQDINTEATEARKAGNKEEGDKLTAKMNSVLDTALIYFENAKNFEPDNIDYLEQFALVALITGKLDKALDGFQKAVEILPTKDNYISIGDILVQKQQFCDAISPYEKALEEDPGDIKLYEVLGDLYESCKMPEKAEEARAKAEELKNL